MNASATRHTKLADGLSPCISTLFPPSLLCRHREKKERKKKETQECNKTNTTEHTRQRELEHDRKRGLGSRFRGNLHFAGGKIKEEKNNGQHLGCHFLENFGGSWAVSCAGPLQCQRWLHKRQHCFQNWHTLGHTSRP